jgi:alkylation response protein AidB-like acyl-CoA dehydrogenase
MIGFDPSSEQSLVQETAARYLRERYGFSKRAEIMSSQHGYDRAIWSDFAEMGWLGLPFDEEFGGVGGSIFDVMLLMQCFGRALVVEPYLSTVVLGGMTIQASGSAAQKRKVLPPLIAGTAHLAFGFAEPKSGYDLFDVETRARRDGASWTISGRKAVVLGAECADLLLVSVRTSGERRDPAGLSLFLLDTSRTGLTLRGYQTIDGRRAAEVILDGVSADDEDLIGPQDQASAAIQRAALAGTVAVMGEAVGALAGALDSTTDYLNQREQFGRKLASFQALRHRVADMYVIKEEAMALTLRAARQAQTGQAAESVAMIAAAKAYIGEEGIKMAEDAVQLHGAIAITNEIIVGHYLKKLIAVDRLFGDVAHHLDIFTRSEDVFAANAAHGDGLT